MAENAYMVHLRIMGVPDKFIEHGSVEQLYKDCGLDTDGIVGTVLEMSGR